jgi:hypothetical protein
MVTLQFLKIMSAKAGRYDTRDIHQDTGLMIMGG